MWNMLKSWEKKKSAYEQYRQAKKYKVYTYALLANLQKYQLLDVPVRFLGLLIC